MKLAWLFPGQGAQAVGMGRDVFEELEAAREVFERVDRALGEPLSELCFEGPADTLTLTANAQPAILATSMALLAAIRQIGIASLLPFRQAPVLGSRMLPLRRSGEKVWLAGSLPMPRLLWLTMWKVIAGIAV